MTAPVTNPFALFSNLAGGLLNGGKVYIGVAGQDPETNPQAVFWDEALTIPAAQPLSTMGGYLLRAGTPSAAYTADTYSIRVRDRAGLQVFYQATAPDLVISSFMRTLFLRAADPKAAAALLGAFQTRTDAIAATISPTLGSITTAGYTAPGDKGGALYKRSVAAPTHQGYFQSADGAYWVLAEEVCTPQMFGARGMAFGFDTVAIQNATDYAAGREVFFPKGQYGIDQTITSLVPVRWEGVSTGAGPGNAEQSGVFVSQIVAFFGDKDLVSIVSKQPSIFRNLQFNNWPTYRPATAGAGIKIAAPTGATTANSVIENVSFSNLYRCIEFLRPSVMHLSKIYCDQWIDAGIHSMTTASNEGAGGFWSDLYFFGNTTFDNSAGPCIRMNHGYTTVRDALLLGGSFAVDVSIGTYPAASIRLIGGYYEEQQNGGVRLQTTDGQPLKMVLIDGVEFSCVDQGDDYLAHIVALEYNGGATDWLSLVKFSNPVFRSQLTASAKHIWMQTGQYVEIEGVQAEELSFNSPTGIQITGNTSSASIKAPFTVRGSQFKGTFIKKYDAVSTVQIHDDAGLAFADLQNWANGSKVYVTNGANASNPLTGASTGAMAKRLNGVWVG